MFRRKLALAAVLLLSACSASPGATPTPAITTIRLPMGYIANVQYAPFYVAVDRGYFAAEGIKIDFDYKFETDGVKLVGAGELPFAVVSGEQVVLARAQSLPVKYVMQWYKKFPVAVISLSKSGINTPQDLKGKKIGLAGFFGATYVGWRAFLNANHLSESDVHEQEIGFTQVAALQNGTVDAVVGYTNNEPIVLAQSGYPVQVFAVSDAVDMVANGLLTNEKTIKENPQLIRGMVRALLKGIADTIKDPDAAMQISAKYVEGLKADDPIQKEVLLKTVELMQGGKPGESTATAWTNTQDALLSMGQVKNKMDVGTFYTNEFLP
ncbi:MAG: ABC transporter substrate-binding protein [Chloroflexi bacterium]|nr:ABC transporter substrate-binding protein [Chloroflexota bacterium]MCL5274782.1 ABC transporter substrate-binding protein [Chloroflexota bacterium]